MDAPESKAVASLCGVNVCRAAVFHMVVLEMHYSDSRFPSRYLTSLRGHVASVYQVAWSADSRLLVSGSSDSTLKVWDIKTGKLNIDLPGHADEVRGAQALLPDVHRGRKGDTS